MENRLDVVVVVVVTVENGKSAEAGRDGWMVVVVVVVMGVADVKVNGDEAATLVDGGVEKERRPVDGALLVVLDEATGKENKDELYKKNIENK